MKSTRSLSWEICILAGGLSRRMGRDKSRLKLGSRTMLNQIRAAAKALGWPVRVIRRDAVPRCGPLGGLFTALQTTRADAVLFLACDMPWVSSTLIQFVLDRFRQRTRALFIRSRGVAGFPLALKRETLPVITGQILREEFSLQRLAGKLHATCLPAPRALRTQLRNVNTPEEWQQACRDWPSC